MKQTHSSSQSKLFLSKTGDVQSQWSSSQLGPADTLCLADQADGSLSQEIQWIQTTIFQVMLHRKCSLPHSTSQNEISVFLWSFPWTGPQLPRKRIQLWDEEGLPVGGRFPHPNLDGRLQRRCVSGRLADVLVSSNLSLAVRTKEIRIIVLSMFICPPLHLHEDWGW